MILQVASLMLWEVWGVVLARPFRGTSEALSSQSSRPLLNLIDSPAR